MSHEEEKPFNIKLPTHITSDSDLIYLGLEFAPLKKGDKWRKARVGGDWTVRTISSKGYLISDENGFRRGWIHIQGDKVQVTIYSRFSWGQDTSILDLNTRFRCCVWDAKKSLNKDDQVIFEVNHPLPNNDLNKNAYERAVRSYLEKRECLNWLEKKFPDWESKTAYWEKD